MASANTCGCGFIFDADAGSFEAVELVSQEQELYEAYLAARLDQARRAAELAIESLAADPLDEVKVAAADRANQELEQLNTEYESQLGTLDTARQEAERARRQAEAGQKHRLAQAEEAASNLAKEITETGALQRTRPGTSARPALTTRQVAQQAVADFEKLEPVTSPGTVNREITRVRAGRTRFNATEAIRARRAAQALIAQKAAAASSRRTTQFEMPPQLKKEVSEKAEEIVQNARQSLQHITDNLAAAAQALGGSGTEILNQHQFRAAQQDRLATDNRPQPANNPAECPNCTAQIDRAASVCGCGHPLVSGGSDLPGLSLGPDDAAKLSEFI